MKNVSIELKNLYNVRGGRLTAYVADMPFDSRDDAWRRPAVIVVPGGAYRVCSKREQEPVAFEFLAKGYNVFVLEYLCITDGAMYPEQLLELASAVDYIRGNAALYSINLAEIFAVGFSAGGHLTACLSTDYTIAQREYGADLDCALTACGLIYPVISDKYLHNESHTNLGISADKVDRTRLDEIVCSRTCPAYIFSTYMDRTVPSMNSIKYAESLAANGIEYELHIYKNGDHGMSVANAEINSSTTGIHRNRAWVTDCAEFFRDYVEEKF